jgi:hypothetical protein
MTEEALALLGVAVAGDRMKIAREGARLAKQGRADVESFLATLLGYVLQQLLVRFTQAAQAALNPALLLEQQFEGFVQSLDWYQANYKGKKELTAFQTEVLYVDFMRIKQGEVADGGVASVGDVVKSLVKQALTKDDDMKWHRALGLTAKLLTKALHKPGTLVMAALRPSLARLFDVYVEALQKDISNQHLTATIPTKASLKAVVKSVVETSDAILVNNEGTAAAQSVVDAEALALGHALVAGGVVDHLLHDTSDA